MAVVVNGTPAVTTFAAVASGSATMPAGVTTGELLTLDFAQAFDVGITTPSGWTPIIAAGDGFGSTSGASFYRIADGSEGASLALTFGGSCDAVAIITRHGGFNSAAPINGTPQSGSGTSGSTTAITSPSVTTTVDGCLIRRVAESRQSAGIATPSGQTDGGTGTTGSGSTNSTSRATYSTQATAGATGTVTFTSAAGGDREWVSLTYAIAPSPGPTITAQPSDQTVNNGATATFSVTASGTAPITYQWQDNSSGSFANISGATSSSYSPTASYSMQGRQYRCNVSDANGGPVSSGAATLRVAWNSGTGPWVFSSLGHPRGAGSFESWVRGAASGGGGNVTLSLSGVAASGQVGTLVSGIAYAAAGAQATAQAGSVKAAISYPLTGTAATGQVGTVTSGIAYALTGDQASGQVGIVSYASADVTLALTGVAATGAIGSVVPNVAYVLTGIEGAGAVGSVVPSASYALAGIPATGNVGAVVANASYALAGDQATGQVGSVGAGNDVSLSLTGVQASGAAGGVASALAYPLTGAQGSGQPGALTGTVSAGVNGVQASGASGAVAPSVAYGVTGVSAAGSVGSVAVPGDVTIALTGVEALGQVGDVSVAPDRIGGGYDDDKPKRRKHRWLVQVGNKVYEVESAQAARDLMDRIDAEEAPKLEKAIQERMQVKKPRARIVSAPVPVAQAKQRTDDAALVTQMLLRRIAEYNAIIDAVVRLAEEQDDEEALLMLL